MKSGILIIFFIAITLRLNAQPDPDSLLKSMNSLDSENRISKLNELCWEYRSQDPELAIKYGLLAAKELDNDSESKLRSVTYNYLGVIYGNLGKLDSAFYYYNLAIASARDIEDSVQIAYSLNNIGDYYFKNALYSIALEKIFEANEIFDRIGDDRGYAYTLNDIGEIYLKQKDYDKALEYFLKSGQIRSDNDDKRGMAKSLINQAAVLVNKGLDNEALEIYYKALYLSKEIGYVKGESWVWAGISDIYFKQGNFEQALENRQNALKIDLEIGNKYGELINYNQIGLIYLQTNQIKLAEKYLIEAKAESGSTGHLDQLMISYNYLKNLYVKAGDYYKGYKYLSSYESLKDSIYSHENYNRIADLQTAFFTERKERENELLKKDIEFEQATRNYLLLIFVLIIVAGLVIISKYKSERRSNKLLKENNLQKDKMFSIVGHDLRNPAGAVNNYLELISIQYESFTDEEKKELITQAYSASEILISLLQELLEWGRLSRDLIQIRPEVFNLNESVEEIFKMLSSSAAQKNINLLFDGCNIQVETDKVMINTVLRNFVSNAIKFTPREGSVRISYSEDEHFNYISTIDTGIGIEPERAAEIFRIDKSTSTKGTENEPGTGLGLPICKEFVEKCGGKIRVNSKVGKGSTFTIVLPK